MINNGEKCAVKTFGCSIKNCIKCNDQGICLKCEEGYFNDTERTCKKIGETGPLISNSFKNKKIGEFIEIENCKSYDSYLQWVMPHSIRDSAGKEIPLCI